MALSKQSELHKVSCVYGERASKTYIFLCDTELFQSLSDGDLVVVDSREEYRIVKVIGEDERALDSSINYKRILKKL